MKQLNTYDTKDEGEAALAKIDEPKRLASERDSTEVIYNLFGTPSWGNFYKLGMFDLDTLKTIVENKKNGLPYDEKKHREIITMLQYVANSFEIEIPSHWK
ncbi:hypothetical protein P3532_10030 [Vibrio parahaemolyticus]|uniref:hypothetical protein n=1 Tax=Vibrio parahaemolyticus TaxID=670 RepID=UPI001A8F7276|nr:hypothetical protein [Vibrio parahaemolyticus]MBY7763318.1 hypothetical protein [Vibrio fluvialis]MBO0187574.1 hypothetical protein [Vibrio parahaemolyticus]MBO0219067.1 hypothetical protein [Vibrio parahaemolyticus]MBY7771936.1 hypothetical protein [Vibrio fluvialis]MBY7776279.1 hypothetical protein [Vibrio fluvialis]